MIILVDNYDSFTYNLQDYVQQLGVECKVVRNDEYSLNALSDMQPSAFILSPGPKRPKDAGICMSLIEHFHTKLPMLGICLGHQAIGEYFGLTLSRSDHPMHGKTSWVRHKGHDMFKGVPSPFEVMRYHSLILENPSSGPIEVMAATEDDIPMAIRHRNLPLFGLQFHPESILTPHGLRILQNWVYIHKLDKEINKSTTKAFV